MSNEEQVKTLKEILSLENYLISAEKKLFSLKSESFNAPPQAPICGTVTRTYPEIVSKVKFNKILAIIPTLFFTPWIAIYYFGIYKPLKRKDIENIRNSEEYKAECAKLDASYDAQEKAFKQQYEEAKKKYDTETLPMYNNQLNAWTIKHDAEIDRATDDLMAAKNKLNTIYESTKIVPRQYRSLEALQYIYDLISTSDYDITYAISNYDTHRQREIDSARLREQQLANDLADEQASLLSEQNQIAEQARKDARFANAVNMVQNHNRNKSLKSINNKLK